jgi:predicted nucleotidyltransferase
VGVKEVNEAGKFLYRVRKVALFGSFLTESSTVGDLDIAIELVPKESGNL